ncbi:hypothetical protein [Thermoflexibacter ruber]|uniref:Uncharacterized protein n=1 Tax=Thermoflexibacter ruber TaxID=1003 RepID=A0A1I2JVH9_9BACT|nr:hypothetical protein [Thermoflexibacter ruber]SFF58842.1 hypothetical protein SAMN04488541_10707 [Thermoflexibacter ruber]
MTSNQSYITEQHKENKSWLASLEFYKDEIKVLRNRLDEVASKNSDKEIKIRVSHFENQLIINDEQLDELKHAIKMNQAEIEQNITENPVASDHRKAEDHVALRDRFNTFEQIFKQLREEMNEFLAKVL